MLRNWGVHKLAAYEYKESIDEMRHADRVIERILFLEGLPNLQTIEKLLIGENVSEIIDCDLTLEETALPILRTAISDCENTGDFVTRSLFAEILKGEEAHVDWLETQRAMIERMGIQNYIQLQSEAAES